MGGPGFKSQLYPLLAVIGLLWGHQYDMIYKKVLYILCQMPVMISCYSYCFLLFLWSQEIVHIIYSSLKPRKGKHKNRHCNLYAERNDRVLFGSCLYSEEKESLRDYRDWYSSQGLWLASALVEPHLFRPLCFHQGREEVPGKQPVTRRVCGTHQEVYKCWVMKSLHTLPGTREHSWGPFPPAHQELSKQLQEQGDQDWGPQMGVNLSTATVFNFWSTVKASH